MLIGDRIRKLRKAKGLTQGKLGEFLNVTKVSISCYENEKRSPDLETFETLVDTLETTPNYLLGRDKLVIAEEDEEYKTYLSKKDIEIINELKKNKELMKFLREDPKRGVEYIVKKVNN
ncbi:MAG: helix-turn-helix transcriptional regulator [Bacilli bacterium]|nr:helix-turn-helix transcriptional regulator [Bacilli bacterium]